MNYILKIRVGEEYYPVNWDKMCVCWDGLENEPPPTIFTEVKMQDAEILEQLSNMSLGPGDFVWSKIVEDVKSRR